MKRQMDTLYQPDSHLRLDVLVPKPRRFLSLKAGLMKTSCTLIVCLAAAAAILLLTSVRAANVEPGPGYTNAFDTQPLVADWATASIAGGANDTYSVDTDVNANAWSTLAVALTPDTGNPPPNGATAVWSSTGFYIQTRPTGNRYSALLGSFINNTGTNATEVTLSYLFTLTGEASAEEAERGSRVYYSLTGLPNSWTNLPALNSTAIAGTFTVTTNVALNWTNGASLFLLWADDNASGFPQDAANQIDNFSLQVTAGTPVSTALTSLLVAPTNNALFVTGAPIIANALVTLGAPPYSVEFFTNSGSGSTIFQSAGVATTAPFELDVGGLSAGTYNIYALASDSAATSTASKTNTFIVVDPIAFTLVSPANDSTYDHLTSVTGAVALSGGTPPYSVEYYLDDAASGSAITSPPYEHDFGAIFVGNHTIRATVTDARGWTSNSAVHTIHVTGPLGVQLIPADGTTYNYGQSVTLSVFAGGGTAPYSVTFYTNDQPAGSLSSSPFSIELGSLPEGSYTSYVHASDSSLPPEQTYSTTNVITIVPNPLSATLSNAPNGIAGQAFTLAATALVGAPVTVSSVEFFVDGVSAVIDSTAPYSASLTNLTIGTHSFFAIATDSLGRTSFTATNQAMIAADSLANNHFTNRFLLTGAIATATGSNVGATTEPGEPTGGGFGNNRGATLWWTWTAPATGTVRIDTFGSSFNTVLGVYTGSAVNALTLVALNNNAPGSNNVSLVTFNAQQGTAYQIQVGGAAGFGGGNPATGFIELNLRMALAVSIASPTNNTVVFAGSNIVVTANVISPAGPAQVEYYRSGLLLGSVPEPYSLVLSNPPLGTNSFLAIARDTVGGVATSAVVNVLVANVGVTILSPVEGAMLLNTNPITVTAFVRLLSGSITNVDFFVDGIPFGQDGTAPFSGTWSNVTSGSHRLTAVATSDTGETYDSQRVNIGVASPLVPYRAVWKYLDNGSDQGTSWIAPDFDDSAWASGSAEFGYGDLDEATVVSYGLDTSEKYITTYFRRMFVVTNRSSFASLLLSLERDDGGVVYLNGNEIFRTTNMPPAPAPITFTTTATTAVDDVIDNVPLNLTNVLDGTNVLAVEIHQQSANSSDLSFNLQFLGLPPIIRNIGPAVAILSPTNDAHFAAAASIIIEAMALDAEGSVARVELFVDGTKLGELTETPYNFVWDAPPIGAHTLTVRATDDEGATRVSGEVRIGVYDAVGTPFANITSPADGAVVEGPTALVVTANAIAIDGVNGVLFFANGLGIGADDTAPYETMWDAPFGTNALYAVVTDINGVRGTSAVSTVVITIPPTNVIAPTVTAQSPLPGTVSNLTSIAIIFSERVQNVDASDLLINGRPATSVAQSTINNQPSTTYIFSFPQPAYGAINVSWAVGHGITDEGWPTVLAFDATAPGATWSYDLIDRTSPTILARSPAAGSTVTTLQQISVTFSEPVTGVEATDLLVNGVRPFAVEFGSEPTTYIFLVSQPSSGNINVSWATNHGITDLALPPNTFNRLTGAWNFSLDARTPIIQSNSTWLFVKGADEASIPVEAWRETAFDDSGWSNASAPFFFGDTGYTNAASLGTPLTDMQGNYSSVYLRKEFAIEDATIITNLFLTAQSDDGFVAWLNGTEIARFNVPTGHLAFNAIASTPAPEPQNNGAAWFTYALSNGPSLLVSGMNVLAVHAFNQSLAASGDFGFNAQLYSFLPDFTLVVPRMAEAIPASGDILFLTNIIITFTEPVQGVDPSDLLVNGIPAASVSPASEPTNSFIFSFSQPPYGPVVVTWAQNHGIVDLDNPPKPFDANAPNATLLYTLINPSNPRVAAQTPIADAVLTNLTEITVAFTESVTGIEAADLLINGVPSSMVTPLSGSVYAFTFPRPLYGDVAIRWADDHGIQDLETPANDFDPTRFGGQWNYTLVNPVPSVELVRPQNLQAFLAPATISIEAEATDNDGTIIRVDFYQGGNKLGESTTAPYTLVWSNVLEGDYVLSAVATDNTGIIATSPPVSILVVTSFPIVLLRGPYLQIGTPTSGLIRWRTDLESDGVVFYGTEPGLLTNVVNDPFLTNEHIVEISGLQPDTRYYYSIGSSGQRLAGGPDFWFRTSPVPGTRKPTRMWVLGDAGTAGNTAPDRQASTRDAFYRYAATNGPADLWLMLGDNAYDRGLDDEHQRAIFDMYPSTLRNLFLWPAIGNHETSQSTTLETFPYLDIFSLPRNGEAGGVPSGTEKYYSFDYANIHFVCLDSMTSGRTANTPMAQWLTDDLAATTQEWIIVFFHHPPYTKGSHDSDAEQDLVQIRQNLVPILESNGVDLVLSGHSHCYERSFLLHGQYGLSSTLTSAHKIDGGDGRTDGTGAYRKNDLGLGVVYTVAGSSGQATFGQLNHPAHYFSLLQLGSMVIDVNSNRLDARFLHADGSIRDYFTIVKPVASPPPAPLNLIAVTLSSNEIALTWTDVTTNETGFSLERSVDGTNFVELLTTAANFTNALDGGLSVNTTYYYRVRTAVGDARSDFSNIASATTVVPSSVPVAPSELVAAADNGAEFYRSHIILRWRDRSANEAGFIIERSSDGSDFIPVSTVGADITRFRDQGLDSATSYFYRVRSFNGAGNSAASNMAGEQTHPQTDVVVVGATATFHAGVEGQPFIRYQWRFEDTPISAATNETLVLENVMPFDEGAYTVDLTDTDGRTTSNPAYLFVIAGPMIVTQPVSRTNLVGSPASFSVQAAGDAPLTYQWRHEGEPILGAIDATLAILGVQPTDQGAYDVIVENAFGSTTSLVAYLVVNIPPVAVADTVFRWRGENVAIQITDLLANDFDPDGDLISLLGVTTNSLEGGTVQMLGRYVVYDAPMNFEQPDSFVYSIVDHRGGIAAAQVSIEISSNTAPVFVPVPDVIAAVLSPVVVTNVASDADVPGNNLIYSFASPRPANARLDPVDGVLVWTPSRQHGPSTNVVTLRVTDDGRPALSNTHSFTIVVRDYIEVTAGSTVVEAGQSASVPLDVFSSAGLRQLQLALEYPESRLRDWTIEPLAPDLTTFTVQAGDPGQVLLTFNADGAQSLQGTQQLARLHFTASAGGASSFLPLKIQEVRCSRAEPGLEPSALMNNGRVAVVGSESLLEAIITSIGERQLIIYGPTGTYTIESSVNPTDPSSWSAWRQITTTASSHAVPLADTQPVAFYRLRSK